MIDVGVDHTCAGRDPVILPRMSPVQIGWGFFIEARIKVSRMLRLEKNLTLKIIEIEVGVV